MIEEEEGTEKDEKETKGPSRDLASTKRNGDNGKEEEKAKAKEKQLIFPDGTAVAAPGLGIHQIIDGTRRWVPDTWTQTWLGIRMDEVVILFPEQLLAIPAGPPIQSRAPEEPLF